MANRIKGITVEIGGDTTGLDKALKSVNSSIIKTQSALNDVNRPSATVPDNVGLEKEDRINCNICRNCNRNNAYHKQSFFIYCNCR